jgi:hypothetical protein
MPRAEYLISARHATRFRRLPESSDKEKSPKEQVPKASSLSGATTATARAAVAIGSTRQIGRAMLIALSKVDSIVVLA